MKFEKITNTKIKISISSKEIQDNNLTIEEILANSSNSQELLESLISKAETEIGFNPEDSHLLIETIAPSSQECIFTITKLLDETPCCTQNSLIFKFNKFDDFVNLCIFLNNFSYLHIKNFSKNFSLILYNNTYFLRLTDTNIVSTLLQFYKTLFAEFGQDASNISGIEGILNEYGKIIFSKNAISKCINICKI